MSSQGRIMKYTRTRKRKPMLDVDLNDVPPISRESHGQEETSTHARSQEIQEGNLAAPIDLDTYDDDDVILSSPRAFAEAQAKNNSIRNRRRAIVVDLESVVLEERPSHNKRMRVSSSQVNHDIFINLEGGVNSMRNSGHNAKIHPPPAPPPRWKKPTFGCPVCMGPLVEEMSTKCGHIFCKQCIKTAIAAQRKCRTCRQKISVKDIIRIYLPAINST